MQIKRISLLNFLSSYGHFLGNPLVESLSNSSRKKGFKFSTDLGVKAIVMNDAFDNIDSTLFNQISDMFLSTDLSVISKLGSRRWVPRKLRPMFVNESDLIIGNRKPIDKLCLTNDVGVSMDLPRGIVTSLYIRGDGNLSSIEGQNAIPMIASSPINVIKAIRLPGDGRWALALFHTGRKETLLFPSDDSLLSFLTEV